MKIAVIGANGRMGSLLCDAIKNEHTVQKIDINTKDKIYDINADMVVDFSLHTLTKDVVKTATSLGVPLIIATTGHTDEEKQYIVSAGDKIPIMLSSNFSKGVFTLNKMCRILATLDADFYMREVHHKNKADSPSGTAKMLATNFKNISIQSVRAGTCAGEHCVEAFLDGERLIVGHLAENRQPFISGCVEAINWLKNKPNGLYSEKDMWEDL